MTERTKGKPWLAMAVLAALALGATVFVAQRALSKASDVIVRGEGDALLATLARELMDEAIPPSSEQLERVLAEQRGSGLRYLAIVSRERRVVAQAGVPEFGELVARPGEPLRSGGRVRVAGPLFPPRGPHRRESPRGPGFLLLVVEFEPPVMEQLSGDLTRISIVACVAGGVLLAFAFAWSKSAARLAAVEQRTLREQRLVALGRMSSVMAHELRNPLASLKGHAQLLLEDLDEPRKKAKAERVVRDAERLEQLTTSLLDFVRDGPIERRAIAPAELVARALEHLDAARVQVDLSAAPERLDVDEARLSRALHNLVDNALQATPDGAPVELCIAAAGKGASIEVRDHGPGIPAGSEAQMFEPFHTTRVRGTGLGLAVARRIAEQHGGSLSGENHPQGGAVFRLRLAAAAPS